MLSLRAKIAGTPAPAAAPAPAAPAPVAPVAPVAPAPAPAAPPPAAPPPPPPPPVAPAPVAPPPPPPPAPAAPAAAAPTTQVAPRTRRRLGAAPADPAAAAQAVAPAAPPATVAPAPAAPLAAPASIPSSALAPTAENPFPGVGNFVGDWDSSDMAMPYLSLVGKQSKVFDQHPDWLGQWLYDKNIPLGSVIRVVFFRSTKLWMQDLEYGSQNIPQKFTSLNAAAQAGMTEADVIPTADLDLLIEVPLSVDGAADLAHIVVGENAYILTRYTVQRSSYGKTARVLLKDAGGFLRGSLINGFYELSTKQVTGDNGSYHVPELKADGPTPLELRQEIADRLSMQV